MAKKVRFLLPWLTASFAMLSVLISIFNQFHWGPWQDQIYFDADNITLALVAKSIADGEPFRWVFSSQSFLFPEAPIYFISLLFTQSYQLALLATAYLNFFIVVGCLYLISYQIGLKPQRILLVITVFLTAVLVVSRLEYQPDVNRNTIFSLIFLATYYSGVVLTALFQMWLLLLFLKPVQKNKLILVFAFISVGGLTGGSNPLYLLQFLVPLAVLSFLFLLDSAWRNYGKCLLFLIALTVAGSFLIRQIFAHYVVASVESYIKPQLALEALSKLQSIVLGVVNEPAYLILWILWFGLYALNAWYFAAAYRSAAWRAKPTLILLYGFLLIAPPMMILGVIVSGNYHTRYFLPAPIFILFCTAITFGLGWPSQKMNSLTCLFLVLCSFVFFHTIAFSAHHKSIFKKDIECYLAHVKGRPMTAVTGYFARYLKLYGHNSSAVFQVEGNFRPFNWLSNIQNFDGISIDAVIVSKLNGHGYLNESDLAVLGPPTAVFECALFDIYRYDSNTTGYRILNQRIRSNSESMAN